jgi:hypothetical protein
MTDQPPALDHLPAEERQGQPDASGCLDVTGPTARQELLLRRQKLWTEKLTREQASQLIGDFLARKHAERSSRQPPELIGPDGTGQGQ